MLTPGRGRPQALVLLSLFAVACGGDDGGLGPPPPAGFEATGDWHFTDDVSAGSLQIRCTSDGIFSITVTGNSISGSGHGEGVCTTPEGTFTDSSSILLTGTLDGHEISFHDGACAYTGTLYDAGGGQVKASGPETCNVDNGAGRIYTLKGTWEATYLGDVTAPVASGTRTGPFGDTAVVVMDTLTIAVHATDNKKLAWVGYSVGNPPVTKDSTALTGTTADVTFKMTIPALTSGPLVVAVFARDSAGYRGDSTLAPISVLPGTRRSMQVLTLPAPIYDVAVNPKHGLVYLTYPGRREIGVINLATGSFAPSIPTPFPPRKLEVSAGADSLIISVDSQPALAIVGITPPGTTIVRVDSNDIGGAWEAADNVRAMSNGKVLVTLKPREGQNSSSPRIVDYDLTTGLSRQRVMSDEVQWLARSWDRRMLATATGSSTPVAAQLYTAATDTFTDRQVITIPVWVYSASADTNGSRYLFANALFDGALNGLRSFTDPEFQQGGGTVLSPDGATAYLGTWSGFLIVRTSDGAVIERSRLPFWPLRLAITADGGTLIAIGGSPTYFEPPNNQVAIIKLRGDD